MGVCGCGDCHPFAQMPGPEGSVYLIEFYRGCKGCDSDAGVVIHKLSDEEVKEFEWNDLPQAPFEGAWPAFSIPVVEISTEGARKEFDRWWGQYFNPLGNPLEEKGKDASPA